MHTFWQILLLAGIALFIWGMAKLEPDAATKQKAKADARAERDRQRQALKCPHCGVSGQVTTRSVNRKQGISGGKATGAVLTGGASLFATGLSRKQSMTRMSCGNCGTGWDVA